MLGHAAAVRPASGNDDPERNGRWRTAGRDPPALDGDADGQPTLTIGGADQLVDIGDVGLQFDHEQGTPTRVPGEDVDHAALAADRERNLGRGDPFRKVAKRPRDRLMKPRMPGVEKAIEVAGSPAAEDVDPDVQRGGHFTETVE
jgi:hypothetical protein